MHYSEMTAIEKQFCNVWPAIDQLVAYSDSQLSPPGDWDDRASVACGT
jgi:hypothetical protein